MSSVHIDAPTVKINAYGLENFLSFIFVHDQLLKQFGGMKIQLTSDCLLALKKRKKSPPCTTIQRINKLDKSQLIYSIHEEDNVNMSMLQQRAKIENESTFFTSLFHANLRYSSISISSNKSFFFEKAHGRYFDIHRLPRRSLLKLAGKTVVDQFLPCLTRSHMPGAIYPLTSTRQNLFALDYHHEGGARHWYIIPASERETLRKVIKLEDDSICFEHQKVFIDPSLFDKHHIRYHRIIQYPNEFVVLSSGVLSQSFMEDKAWNESINFALPTWIEEGHAKNTTSSCQCHIKIASLSLSIDLKLFKHRSIQKYIESRLYLTINHFEESFNKAETIPPLINMKPVISLNQIETTLYGISSPLFPSSISSSFIDVDNVFYDENTSQHQMEPYTTINFETVVNDKTQETTLIDSYSTEFVSSLFKTETNESDSFLNTLLNNENDNNDLVAFDDFMDILTGAPSNNFPICSQMDNLVNEYHRNSTQQLVDLPSMEIKSSRENSSDRRSPKKRQVNKKKRNRCKTLFVSGLDNNINLMDIRRHFIGSIKVTLKQCKTASNLQYAFVLHQTPKDAERNLFRPINKILFGSKSHVEYAYHHSNPPVKHQYDEERTIVVRKIPENVSENELRRLFIDSYLTNYCPARIVHSSMKNMKVLGGYAFLRYTDRRQATNVIQHSDQYYINGQRLTVSYCHNTK